MRLLVLLLVALVVHLLLPVQMAPLQLLVWWVSTLTIASAGAVLLLRVHEVGLIPRVHRWAISPARLQLRWIRSRTLRRRLPSFDRSGSL